VCSVSNELATNGCEHSGTAYTIDLPESRIPHDPCQVHRGSILAQDEQATGDTPKRNLPQSILHSFRKFFGGQ
jgi:penicillin-binding protein 1A